MIQVENLTKYYGDYAAIEDVSFQVHEGEILGFLGPNAAGKTTTMRIIAGFMPPTSGRVTVAGHDVVKESVEARRNLGYLPENVPLYEDMTVRDYLSFCADLRGVAKADIRGRVETVMGSTMITEYENTLITKLSKGFRQRVGIAQALVHDPKLIILDEPTVGLDPRQIIEVRELIRNLRGTHTVILSTHILPEVQMLCDRIVIISEGRVAAIDTPEALTERLQGAQEVRVEVRGPEKAVAAGLKTLKGVSDVRPEERRNGTGKFLISSAPGVDIRESVADKIVKEGWGLLEMSSVVMSLEDIFVKLTDASDKSDGSDRSASSETSSRIGGRGAESTNEESEG
jgi:ABC-2 type transport system ATP-binding protein